MWLVATILNSACTEHFLHCIKFCWTTLAWTLLLDHSGLDCTAGMRVERSRRIWEMLGGRLYVIWGWIGYGVCSRWGVKVQT